MTCENKFQAKACVNKFHVNGADCRWFRPLAANRRFCVLLVEPFAANMGGFPYCRVIADITVDRVVNNGLFAIVKEGFIKYSIISYIAVRGL